ncbi:hypothetical protein [Acinetobacter courvalinii]|uniref:Uncharacterized protein n=1 Tax=Acinetobacter courvalinii TaxID=280147 RepID=N9PYS7_9GAMM|nr:hypothetical protein [Acinetobacter courvalinii]ENX38604.1 hypothetical protein F888_01473 [Acinetobacter courvalinii]KAB0657576.1 hypothetical protein F7P77_07485 [Acinetobacter courvalinii]RSN82909.1 hypothetical protein EA770_04730 [Acinetobacter baumannii]GGH35235.1 hypothetical protein GCM10007354_18320 [Acinetobacter courvalinii]
MSKCISQLPADFSMLQPFVKMWALNTAQQRHRQRLNATTDALHLFYNAMLPQMRHLLAMLDTYPLGHLPDELHPLYWLSLSFAEVAPHIELYKGQVGVPFAFEEKRFIYEKAELVDC